MFFEDALWSQFLRSVSGKGDAGLSRHFGVQFERKTHLAKRTGGTGNNKRTKLRWARRGGVSAGGA